MKSSNILWLQAFACLVTTLVPADLSAQEAPSISEQPVSLSVVRGGTAMFSVTASGTEPMDYQWHFEGDPIDGEIQPSLTVSNVQSSHAGSYFAVVSNGSGSVTSDVVTLTVTEPLLDLNGDQSVDILWEHPDGRLAAWLMDGTNYLGLVLLSDSVAPGWRMAGQADLNQDGNMDFVWHHRNGSLAAWLMEGTNQVQKISLRRSAAGWRVVALHDFNADGSADVLWQRGDGRLAVWYLQGTNFNSAVLVSEGRRSQAGWRVVAVLDFDADGDGDLLWQHASGRLAVWFMEGVNPVDKGSLPDAQRPSMAWRVRGAADFDGDGKSDLLWQHPDGRVVLWFMDGLSRAGAILLNGGEPVADGWRIVGPR